MTSTKNQVFHPSPVHMRPHGPDPSPLWTSTRGRHEIHLKYRSLEMAGTMTYRT